MSSLKAAMPLANPKIESYFERTFLLIEIRNGLQRGPADKDALNNITMLQPQHMNMIPY